MKQPAKAALTVLSVLVSAILLAGCPQTKLPDAPPNVPQPKATVMLQQQPFEI